jgi:hypothetical protein
MVGRILSSNETLEASDRVYYMDKSLAVERIPSSWIGHSASEHVGYIYTRPSINDLYAAEIAGDR